METQNKTKQNIEKQQTNHEQYKQQINTNTIQLNIYKKNTKQDIESTIEDKQ